jgi:endonuclease YncB( thermonuclease family)
MTMVWRASMFALPLAFAAISSASTTQEGLTGVASVVDGDTIEIHGRRIRLHGIDAPESSQLCVRPTGERWRCGQQASVALADRIERATVSCQPRDRDRYDRIVAICFKGNEDLNRWMVASGWAVAFRRYSKDYVADEDVARRSRANIWSGDFDMPWDWRAQRRSR